MTFAVWRVCAMLLSAGLSQTAANAASPGHAAGLVAHHCFDSDDGLAQDCKGQEHAVVSGGTLKAAPGWRGQGVRVEPLPGQTARLVVPRLGPISLTGTGPTSR